MKIVGTVRLTAFQLACNLPRNALFRAWVGQWMVPPREATIDDAAAFIRAACDIESRRQLEDDAGAAQRFHNFLRRPFVEWRSLQHQPRSNRD